MTDRVVAHQDYLVRGGGELVAEEIANSCQAELVAGHIDEENIPDNIQIQEVGKKSLLHKLIPREGILSYLGHLINWRDNAPELLKDYDTVIVSGNEPLWYLADDEQTVVAYCHSPPWWMYDRFNDIDGFLGRTAMHGMRFLFEPNIRRPDMWIASSETVARRMKAYWGLSEEDIRICYPPVNVTSYGQVDSVDNTPSDYLLVVSRLSKEKHIDECIKAAKGSSANLLIAGKGPEEDRLRKVASATKGVSVDFLGYVSESRKRELLSGADAFLMAGKNEDFGIVTVEALASGTPVLGISEGFTQHLVINGKNGYTAPREHFDEAIRKFHNEGVKWSSEEIRAFAGKFSADRFQEKMVKYIETAEELTEVVSPWEEKEK